VSSPPQAGGQGWPRFTWTVTVADYKKGHAITSPPLVIKDLVITGIAGSHIKSFNSHGMVAIKDKEVSE